MHRGAQRIFKDAEQGNNEWYIQDMGTEADGGC